MFISPAKHLAICVGFKIAVRCLAIQIFHFSNLFSVTQQKLSRRLSFCDDDSTWCFLRLGGSGNNGEEHVCGSILFRPDTGGSSSHINQLLRRKSIKRCDDNRPPGWIRPLLRQQRLSATFFIKPWTCMGCTSLRLPAIFELIRVRM